MTATVATHERPTTSAATGSSGTPTPTTTRPRTRRGSTPRRVGRVADPRGGARRARRRRAGSTCSSSAAAPRSWSIALARRRRAGRRRSTSRAGSSATRARCCGATGASRAPAVRAAARRSRCADGVVRPRVLRPRRDVVLRSRAHGAPRWRALLRPGGRLVFSHTTPWPYLAWNFETGARRPAPAPPLLRDPPLRRRRRRGHGRLPAPVRRVDPLLPSPRRWWSTTWWSCARRSTRARPTTTSTHVGPGAGRPSRSGSSARRRAEPSAARVPDRGTAPADEVLASPRRRRTRCPLSNAGVLLAVGDEQAAAVELPRQRARLRQRRRRVARSCRPPGSAARRRR